MGAITSTHIPLRATRSGAVVGADPALGETCPLPRAAAGMIEVKSSRFMTLSSSFLSDTPPEEEP
jgi:hypothetical protein